MSNLKLDQWFGDTDPRTVPQLLAVLRNPVFRPADTGLPSRTLQRWEAEDLIECSREKSGNWRAFSYPEFVWLLMVKKMRDMGIPYLLIKSVKNRLFGAVSTENEPNPAPRTPFAPPQNGQEGRFQRDRRGTYGEPYRVIAPFPYQTLSEALITRCVRFRTFCYLQIFPDLGAFPVLSNEGDFALPAAPPERIAQGGFFTVPVSAIVRDHFLESGAFFEPVKVARLSPTQAAIFDIIQTGDYEKVTINLDQAEPVSLELVRNDSTDTSIGELLEGSPDRDAGTGYLKGKITRIEKRVVVDLSDTTE